MRIIVPILILMFLQGSVFAQDNPKKKELVVDIFEKGLALRNHEKDSSYYYMDLASKNAIKLHEYSDALDILLECIFTSGIHYDLKKYRFYLDEMGTLLQKDSVKNELEYLKAYQNRFVYEEANYLYDIKNYTESQSKFKKLYDEFTKKNIAELDFYNLSILIYTTEFLASIYMDTQKYDLAENYFNQSLSFTALNEIGKQEGLDRSTNRLLAKLYILTGRNQKADKVLANLLSTYQKLYGEDKEYKNSLVVVCQRAVKNLIRQDSLEKALKYLDASQKYLLSEDPFYKESLLLYGDIYMKLDEDQNALEHYNNALNIFRDYRQKRPHQDVAEVYGKIAKFHLKKENYTEGLAALLKSLNNSGGKVDLDDIAQNPNPSEVFSKRQLLQLLDLKLQLLQIAHYKTDKEEYLDAAIQTNKDILSTFDLLKKEFESKLDKQFLAETVYPIFHRMLEVGYEAYKENPTPELFELALNISEKNKDFLLLEALRNANANQYGGIPSSVIEKEARLRAEISNMEKNLFDTTEGESNFSEDLFKLKQEYFGLLDTLESKYPKYHELKYQNKTLDLATVRAKVLDDNGILISYTMTDEYLYAVVMNGTKQDFLKLSFDEPDREAIIKFYRLISSPSINGTKEDISRIAESLFEKILKQPLADLDSENLIIIPDGELHYLPFDLLQENRSYLLETKSIGYGNSVTSLLELKEKGTARTNKMLAFAPSFSGTITTNSDRQFGKLLYNDDEVQKISTYYDTKTLYKNKATLANFKTNASHFNIFHLATHASANDEYPDYSYLAFAEINDSTESNILYIKDLYNSSLNADMVTLSACQTGIGKLQKGQGMMSLSKGFFYAGAKSLVNTLWKINDKSTVRLMEFFYEGLSKGYSKSEALRKAKLKYLATTDDNLLKHPYYWSAFVVSGDIAPITNTYNLWYFGVAAALVVLLMVFAYSKGKRKVM